MSMILMVKAMQTKVGNPLRKLVLIKLADNANDKGECWPSYQHIADQCEISRRSAMEHIDKLEGMGFLKKEMRLGGEKGNKSNLYILLLSGAGDSLGGALNSLPSAGDSPGGALNSLPSAGDSPGGGAGDSPRISNSFESVKEPLKNAPEKSGQANSERKPKFDFDRNRIKDTWNEKANELGLPGIRSVTDTVEKGLIRLYKSYLKMCKEVGKEPNDMDTVINGYIEHGYQPTKWALGENPEGKKYGIATALTQQKIDEILGG